MRHKHLLSSITLLLMLFSSHLAVAQTLVLHHANGTTTDVELYNMPLIQFDGDKVTITSTVLDMEYQKEDVLRFTYRGSAGRHHPRKPVPR